MLVYLVAYCLASLGAFMLVAYLSREGQDDVYFEELNELSTRQPMAAAALVILVLSMAGLPLTAGFMGKLLVFKDAWAAGLHGLVIIAVLNSVVSAYFYLRFLRAMFLEGRNAGVAPLTPGIMPAGYLLTGVATVVLTLLFGFLPQMLVEWSQKGVLF
jgi:NADH-quinone oxidoreductase subunit N